MYMYTYNVLVLMRDEKEERSKQGQTNNKAKKHSTPKAVTFHSHFSHVLLYSLLSLCIRGVCRLYSGLYRQSLNSVCFAEPLIGYS